MKRFERLGSVAFVTVMISLVFHLIAMSFNHWKEITCTGCNKDDILGSWSTGLATRCYQASLGSLFAPDDNAISSVSTGGFRGEICISNQFLMVRDIEHSSLCLVNNYNESNWNCALTTYDKTFCQCDYLSRTKLVLATTIISAFSLGALVFVSHLVAFVKKDYVVKWLIPICFSALFVAIIFMFVTLVAAGSDLDEDVNELRYSLSILEIVHFNETSVDTYRDQIKNSRVEKYSTKIGWCFGMEILAFHFATVSMVLYLIMFWVKRRPDSIKIIM